MNAVVLIGRLTKDPETRYTSESQMAVAAFTVAIDRPVRAGKDKQSDFPRVKVFGKQAENCERFLTKGRLVGIQGRIQTSKYTSKEGQTVYTTDVVADRVEFLEKLKKEECQPKPDDERIPEGFAAIDSEECPF